MALRTRIWIETTLAAIATLLTVVTLVLPTWIEILFDAAPDAGDGSAERAFALVWIIVAVTFGTMARKDMGRLGETTRP